MEHEFEIDAEFAAEIGHKFEEFDQTASTHMVKVTETEMYLVALTTLLIFATEPNLGEALGPRRDDLMKKFVAVLESSQDEILEAETLEGIFRGFNI